MPKADVAGTLKAGELEALLGFLGIHRRAMVEKIEGLTEEQARWKPASTANSLLNLIVHLTGVERYWHQAVIAGEAIDRDRDAELAELPPGVTVANAVAAYRAEWERSDAVARAASLDALVAGRDSDRNVRWVLLHMVEETARHAGHADITRELIDGSVG